MTTRTQQWNMQGTLDETTYRYRAYDTITEWRGPARWRPADAERDAAEHNRGCAVQGGYGRAIVVQRDGDRMATLDGDLVWPPHGRSTGAALW